MNSKSFCSFFAVCLLFFSCASARHNTQSTSTLTADQLQPFGRFAVNGQQLELISSAVHFGFSFEGKECQLYASINDANGHNYLQYEMDGTYQKRIRIDGQCANSFVK